MGKIKNWVKRFVRWVGLVVVGHFVWEILAGFATTLLARIDLLGLMAIMNQWVATLLYFVIGFVGSVILFGLWEFLRNSLVRKGWLKDKSPRIEPHHEQHTTIYAKEGKVNEAQTNESSPILPPTVTFISDIYHWRIGIMITNPNTQKILHPTVKLVRLIWQAPNGASRGIENQPSPYCFDIELTEPDVMLAEESAPSYVAQAVDHNLVLLLKPLDEFARQLNSEFFVYPFVEPRVKLLITGYVGDNRVETTVEKSFRYEHFREGSQPILEWRQ